MSMSQETLALASVIEEEAIKQEKQTSFPNSATCGVTLARNKIPVKQLCKLWQGKHTAR
jgi:hypothetical protein